MPRETQTVAVPPTYVNSPDSPIRITNYPDSEDTITPIQIVTLNRPDKLNAITKGMIGALIAFFLTVDVDDRVKVIVMTGAGRAFSAGIDLKGDFSQEKNNLRPSEMRDPGDTLALAMFNCSKPIIVAYNGLSVGIGMTSTLAAAIRIRIPVFKDRPCNGIIHLFFLPRVVGHSNATYLLATGKPYPAHSSVLHGIFAEMVPEPKDSLPRAIEVAQYILSNVSTMTIHLNRKLIWRNPGSAEGAHLVDSPLLYDMFGGTDHLEFKKSFFEKRAPGFTDVLSKDAPRTYPWWNELSAQNPPAGKL